MENKDVAQNLICLVPDDLLFLCLQFLNIRDKTLVALVNHKWNYLIKQPLGYHTVSLYEICPVKIKTSEQLTQIIHSWLPKFARLKSLCLYRHPGLKSGLKFVINILDLSKMTCLESLCYEKFIGDKNKPMALESHPKLKN